VSAFLHSAAWKLNTCLPASRLPRRTHGAQHWLAEAACRAASPPHPGPANPSCAERFEDSAQALWVKVLAGESNYGALPVDQFLTSFHQVAPGLRAQGVKELTLAAWRAHRCSS
jgi:redox-sensitive bicupin YhaK (pirin superfamily)